MSENYELLLSDMLKDIQRCQSLPHPEKENAESCFWIARNYCQKLELRVKEKGFQSDGEEIEFFKHIRPQFSSHIEYFIILAEALQFEPSDKAMATDYWREESKRFTRFVTKNQLFVEYLERGEDRNDALYFLRENDLSNGRHGLSRYEIDTAFTTYHEQLIRSYLAHKKYYEFCGNRINNLS